MYQVIDDEASKLANEHIEWFLSMLRPLLFSHFIHGFKHGCKAKDETEQVPYSRPDNVWVCPDCGDKLAYDKAPHFRPCQSGG